MSLKKATDNGEWLRCRRCCRWVGTLMNMKQMHWISEHWVSAAQWNNVFNLECQTQHRAEENHVYQNGAWTSKQMIICTSNATYIALKASVTGITIVTSPTWWQHCFTTTDTDVMNKISWSHQITREANKPKWSLKQFMTA